MTREQTQPSTGSLALLTIYDWVRQRMATAATTILVGLLIIWILLYFVQDSLVFPRTMAHPPAKMIRFENTEQLEVEIEGGGKAVAWFVPAPHIQTEAGADSPKRAPVVVFCHGNAEIIDHQDLIVRGYQRLGVSVLLAEYRGYGRSDGLPSQQGIRKDLMNFYDQISKRPDVDKHRIFFHGRSLGGAVATDLSTMRKPAALITESVFSSIVAMSYRYLAPGILVKHPYRNDRVIVDPASDFPLLMFHGTGDKIVSVRQGRKLRNLANRAGRDLTYIEYPAGHNDFPGPSTLEYWQAIETFLRNRDLLD